MSSFKLDKLLSAEDIPRACLGCGRKATPDKLACARCSQKLSAASANKNDGGCLETGGSVPGPAATDDGPQRNRIPNESSRERDARLKRQRRYLWREAGLCTKCGAAHTSKTLWCDKCKQLDRERAWKRKLRMANARAAGTRQPGGPKAGGKYGKYQVTRVGYQRMLSEDYRRTREALVRWSGGDSKEEDVMMTGAALNKCQTNHVGEVNMQLELPSAEWEGVGKSLKLPPIRPRNHFWDVI